MDDDNKVWHEHYEKTVSTRKVLHSQSALAWGSKRSVVVSECVRRLRNCSVDLPWKQKANFLSDYMGRLKQAGYTENFRTSSLNQAMARYNGMLKADIEGTQPLYRDKNWDRQNRSQKRKKTSWTLDYDGVIFVESTPGGQLAKMYREVAEEFPGK